MPVIIPDIKLIAKQFSSITLRRVGKVTFSVLDQGLTSGANFIVTIYLGRWLAEKEYGAYGIALTIFLFIMGFCSSLILEPMNIFGPTHFRDQLSVYKTKLLGLQVKYMLMVSGGILLFFLILFWVNVEKVIAISVLGLGLALPLISFYWFARRVCYLELNPKLAVIGSFIYALLLLGGSYIFYKSGIISVLTTFLLMGFAGLVAGLVISWRTGISINKIFEDEGSPKTQEILRKHWTYGKWMLGATTAYGLGSLAFPMIIGLFLGLNEVGAYRAMQNLFSPLQQVLTALSLLLLPWISRQRIDGGKNFIRRVILGVGGFFLLISIVYILPLNYFGKQIISFYKRDFYQEFLWVIPFFSINSMIMAVTAIYGVVIRSLERSDIILRAKFWSVLSVLTLGILFSSLYKLWGTMIVLIISVVIEGIVLIAGEYSNSRKWVEKG